MVEHIQYIVLAAVLFPLLGFFLTGLLGEQLGRATSHRVAVSLLGASFFLSLLVFKWIVIDGVTPFNGNLYTWATSGDYQFSIGFLIDRLTTFMMVIVTFVSFLVHIYTIGYMADDPGYQRFFSYISLFTFMMLMLVTANNFLQLFFGWEGVGVASYLLISFWFKRDSATAGGIKAFLVNRVGDLGFLLGIAAVLYYFGTLDYAIVFANTALLENQLITIFAGHEWSAATVLCLLLFTGAMGKSAQVPLHVWLPESMEGPTPISALIHAATMVTAGIFMVSRLSPLYELSPTALSVIIVIGATGALFLGILAIVQHDIKRVVAYSTLSQLGYMVVGLGSSAFAASLFHLGTHACFKALLFLAAGSVIIAMHHEQDMRKMGGLKQYMPITYYTFLLGALSLAAVPPFSGFFSKDVIIEAAKMSTIGGSGYAYFCVLLGAFVTPLYIFRALFLTFHQSERMDKHTQEGLKESPWVVTLPLILLAIPSVIIGAVAIKPVLFDLNGWVNPSLVVSPSLNVLAEISAHFHGVIAMMLHATMTLPFWFAIFGITTAWVFYVKFPAWPEKVTERCALMYTVLLNKYGFDDFNDFVFVKGGKGVANILYDIGDMKLIDGVLVNGSSNSVRRFSGVAKNVQTGYLYHYALAMVIALLIFLTWLILG